MERVAQRPRVHLFVCANVRSGSPLGPGCGDAGERVYATLKEEVAAARAYAQVWVTKTHCLGICPKKGCTVAVYGGEPGILRDVDEDDARSLFRRMLEPPP
ncbi:hypothetical protein BH09MYX1_BH09MYX1_33330 [soil metagenome]